MARAFCEYSVRFSRCTRPLRKAVWTSAFTQSRKRLDTVFAEYRRKIAPKDSAQSTTHPRQSDDCQSRSVQGRSASRDNDFHLSSLGICQYGSIDPKLDSRQAPTVNTCISKGPIQTRRAKCLLIIRNWVENGIVAERIRVREKPTLVGVQYLRGLAALAVVFYHVFSNRVAEDWGQYRDYGVAGVDVFFVISGFIMWRTTSRSTAAAIPDFLMRRVVRIYPAWWIALTVWVAMRFAVPDRLHNADVNTWSLLASYVLFPRYHAVFLGHVWPILVPGWTLQIELLFYLVFAATLLLSALWLRLIAILFVLICLALFGFLHGPVDAFVTDLTQPLMLEFAAGIVIATQYDRLRSMPIWASAAMPLAGFAIIALCASPTIDGAPIRAITLGPAAVLIIAGSVGLESALRAAPLRLPLLIGDASYSLYLTHPISISIAAFVWERLRLPTGSSVVAALFVPVAILISVACALLFYRLFELPLLERLMPLLRRRGRPATLPNADRPDDATAR